MIEKVYGKANNFEIIFKKEVDGRWVASVPSNSDGEYVVEIYVEDYAGNVSYACRQIFTITGHTLVARTIIDGYNGDVKEIESNVDVKKKEFYVELQNCRKEGIL